MSANYRGIGNLSVKERDSIFYQWTVPYDFLLFDDKNVFYSPKFEFSGCTWCLCASEVIAHPSTPAKIFLERKDSILHPVQVKTVTCIIGVMDKNGFSKEKTPVNITFLKVKERRLCITLKQEELLSRYIHCKSGDLIFTCRLECEPLDTKEEKMDLNVTGLEKLSLNWGDLFANKKKCDVVIKVKDKEFLAHKLVLIARSPVFAAMFEHGMIEEKTGVINVPDCDPDSFGDFLKHLYTGKFEGVTSNNFCQLYVTADKYDVAELKSFCVENLKQNITLENVFDIVNFTYVYEETELKSAVQKFFNENFRKIVFTPEWMEFQRRNLLLSNLLLQEMMSVQQSKT